jgi:hypothetical protein
MVDFDLFTSLRYDPKLRSASFNTQVNGGNPSPYLMLPYHVQRLEKAAEAFEWPLAVRTMAKPDTFDELKRKCDDATANIGEEVRRNGLRVSVRPI